MIKKRGAIPLSGFNIIMLGAMLFIQIPGFARDLDDSLSEIVNYSSPSGSFSDMYSSIGLIDKGLGSSGQLVISHGRSKEIFDHDLFNLTFWVKNQKLHFFELVPQRTETKYLPWSIQKEQTMTGWHTTSDLIYLDNNVVGYYVTLHNDQDFPFVIRPVLRVNYTARGDRVSISYSEDQDDNALDHYAISSMVPKTDRRDPDPEYPLRIELKTGFQSGLTPYRHVSEQLNNFLNSRNIETVERLDLHVPAQALIVAPEMTIEAHARSSFQFMFSVAIDEQTDQPDGPGLSGRSIPPKDSAVQTARQRWDELWDYVESNPAVPDEYRDLFAHCIFVLERNSVKFRSQNFGTRLAQYPCKDYYNAHYNWDTCFQSLFMGQYHPAGAWDGLRILAENADENGKWGQFICSNWVRPGSASQPPIAFWTASVLSKVAPNQAMIEELYPALEKFLRWWENNRDSDHDGLYEWVDSRESGWDNSPRWDEWESGDDGEMLESVDLNSYLVVAYHAMSAFAGELGKISQAQEWEGKAKALGELIVQRLLNREDMVFYDRKVNSDEWSKVLTPASFLPLWAGIEMDEESAGTIIRKWLLSEDHFWGEYGFPCVSYSDPVYEPVAYWRGANWLNLSYWMLCVLDKYGFKEEKATARQRILSMATKSRALYEYYNSRTGQGEGNPDYGWAASTLGLIIMEKYYWF